MARLAWFLSSSMVVRCRAPKHDLAPDPGCGGHGAPLGSPPEYRELLPVIGGMVNSRRMTATDVDRDPISRGSRPDRHQGRAGVLAQVCEPSLLRRLHPHSRVSSLRTPKAGEYDCLPRAPPISSAASDSMLRRAVLYDDFGCSAPPRSPPRKAGSASEVSLAGQTPFRVHLSLSASARLRLQNAT